jgi:hypothetical protein
MSMRTLLTNKRSRITDRWFDLILETYPADAQGFLKGEQDRFANPAGHIISRGLEALFDELTNETCSGKVIAALNSIIRIRAVQDFSVSEALAFVFLLKKAMREEMKGVMEDKDLFQEYLVLESRVDAMALSAFDVYMKAREDIHQIRVRELGAEKDRALRVIKMMDHKGDA